MDYNANITETLLATAGIPEELIRCDLIQLYIRSVYFMTRMFFVVRTRVADNNNFSDDLIFNSFEEAKACFEEEQKRFDYNTPKFMPEYYECEYGVDDSDYGPSNPWDAPGMNISDFIRGVY